jgi:mycothiol synthase
MSAVDVKRDYADVAIRDFQPKDYPPVVDIENLLYPEHPTTVEEERFDEENFDTKQYIRRRYVAVESTGRVVGYASFNQMPTSYDPQRFGMWIGVHPDWQRKGFGAALYAYLFEQLRALNAIALRTWVRETLVDSIAWLERRGFRELTRGWESRLPLESFDLSRFEDYWGPPQGIEIATLASELAKDPESLRAMYELDCDISPDEPRVDPFTRPPFEMYRDRILKSPGSLPDAIFLAKDGDRYVGLTELFRNEALPGTLNTGFTGVRRTHRGRGIAFALKLRAMDWAIRHGYREIRTWNNTLNAPMLGINVKLGFIKQPVWITFGKDLAWG